MVKLCLLGRSFFQDDWIFPRLLDETETHLGYQSHFAVWLMSLSTSRSSNLRLRGGNSKISSSSRNTNSETHQAAATTTSSSAVIMQQQTEAATTVLDRFTFVTYNVGLLRLRVFGCLVASQPLPIHLIAWSVCRAFRTRYGNTLPAPAARQTSPC
jgi:hypothetical protein